MDLLLPSGISPLTWGPARGSPVPCIDSGNYAARFKAPRGAVDALFTHACAAVDRRWDEAVGVWRIPARRRFCLFLARKWPGDGDAGCCDSGSEARADRIFRGVAAVNRATCRVVVRWARSSLLPGCRQSPEVVNHSTVRPG